MQGNLQIPVSISVLYNFMCIEEYWFIFLFSLVSKLAINVLISGQGPVVISEFNAMPPMPSGPPANIPLPLPDMSKPPPGFPPGPGFMQQNIGIQQPPPLMSLNVKPPMEMDLMPSMPYYDLPAGLMAPLVKVSSMTLLSMCMSYCSFIQAVADSS